MGFRAKGAPPFRFIVKCILMLIGKDRWTLAMRAWTCGCTTLSIARFSSPDVWATPHLRTMTRVLLLTLAVNSDRTAVVWSSFCGCSRASAKTVVVRGAIYMLGGLWCIWIHKGCCLNLMLHRLGHYHHKQRPTVMFAAVCMRRLLDAEQHSQLDDCRRHVPGKLTWLIFSAFTAVDGHSIRLQFSNIYSILQEACPQKCLVKRFLAREGLRSLTNYLW